MGLISIVSFLSSAQSLWHSSPLWQTRSTVEAKSKLSPPLEPKKKKKSSETNQEKKTKKQFYNWKSNNYMLKNCPQASSVFFLLKFHVFPSD